MNDSHVPKIFNKALTLDESERAEYLQQACKGDATLLNEVSNLLEDYTGKPVEMVEVPAARKVDIQTVVDSTPRGGRSGTLRKGD